MSSIATQLQAIKSAVAAGGDITRRRPQARPSLIFELREAAEIDLRTILPIARDGLEVLIHTDEQFKSFKDTLFSQTSLELDREMMVPKENKKLDSSIKSFLRRLSGYFHLPAALKTLEYLIRRYQVHVFNKDELLLCAFPYHDTHAFVRIVQLIDFGNSMWSFLEGVKTSGAAPPRSVLVQQCIRDKGFLATLCEYASPKKDFQHSRPVICFTTAVVIETLGAIPKLDTDIVQRVLGFVFDGLNPALKGDCDHKAGAMMILGLLATRASLAPKLINNLLFFIARVAHRAATEEFNLHWLRVAVMSIISLVQSQDVRILPKKPLLILNGIRDFASVLSELSNDFNVERFTTQYLESMIDHSMLDESFHSPLINILEVLNLENFMENIVPKVIGHRAKGSATTDNWTKQILSTLEKHCPSAFSSAIRKVLKSSNVSTLGDKIVSETLDSLESAKDMEADLYDPSIWFLLEHSVAEIRLSTLEKISASGILRKVSSDPKKFINLQDAVLQCLHDDDLNVVKVALSIDGLVEVASPLSLLNSYNHVLSKSLEVMRKGPPKKSPASKVAILCLEQMVLEFQFRHPDFVKEVGSTILPLLIFHTKTAKVNFKALELAEKIQWPFFSRTSFPRDQIIPDQVEKFDSKFANSINMKILESFSETFVADMEGNIEWLLECSGSNVLLQRYFYLILLHALFEPKKAIGRIEKLYETCSSALKSGWSSLEPSVDCSKEIKMENLRKCSIELMSNIFDNNEGEWNAEVLLNIFWCIINACSLSFKSKEKIDDSSRQHILSDLFIFFISSSSKNIFLEHVKFLLADCTEAPFQFLSNYFTEEGYSVRIQAESLTWFAKLCSSCALSESNDPDVDLCSQLLLGFPLLLVPLGHGNKDIRLSAMDCVEGLYLVWQRLQVFLSMNGHQNKLTQCVSSPAFGLLLSCLINHKNMISSDANFLPSCLLSLLSSSDDVRIQDVLTERLDSCVRRTILLFVIRAALKLSSYGKLVVLSLLKGLDADLFSAEEVISLLQELLNKRSRHCLEFSHEQRLSPHDVDVMCLLLEVLFSARDASNVNIDLAATLTKALKVDVMSPDEATIVRPCVSVLKALRPELMCLLETDYQDKIFCHLISLSRSVNIEIREAAQDLMLGMNISSSTIVRVIEFILSQCSNGRQSKRNKRTQQMHDSLSSPEDLFGKGQSMASILVALLDILLLKKDFNNRSSLIPPLFLVLAELFAGLDTEEAEEGYDSSQVSRAVTTTVYQARQSILVLLRDITESLDASGCQDGIFNQGNIILLMHSARSTKDVSTRNHVLLLLSSIAGVSQQLVSENIVDLFLVLSESAVKQDDSYSQHVLDNLISILVPCWLSTTSSITKLLQIFINALPDVAEHRRVTLITYLLRTLGGKSSLGQVIVQLFCSVIGRFASLNHQLDSPMPSTFSSLSEDWEYRLAVQICSQYTCSIWFPSLVDVLKEIRDIKVQGLYAEQYLALQFVITKLQDTELNFKLESQQDVDADSLQATLGSIMEETIFYLHVATKGRRNVTAAADTLMFIKDLAHNLLKIVVSRMSPSTYFSSVVQLLGHKNRRIRRKTLGILSETVRSSSALQKKQKEKNKKLRKSMPFLRVDATAAPSFDELCLKLTELFNDKNDDLDLSIRTAAISSLDMLAKEYPSDNAIFVTCLESIVNHLSSDDLSVCSGSIHAAGSLVNALGSKALLQLPFIMKCVLAKSHQFSECPSKKFEIGFHERQNAAADDAARLLFSVIVTLEAVIEKLGGFMNPYLEGMLDLLVLHREFASPHEEKLQVRAMNVRKLLTEKIPVRLVLPPLIRLYSAAVGCGEVSVLLTFQMLTSLTSVMDRESIRMYHANIFELCLTALDLRRQNPNSVNDLSVVEESVLQAIVVLTMKLTETMFRPLFFRSLEWSDSEVDFGFDKAFSGKSLDRQIAFHKLINKMAEQHRSLFVPYFKYLIEGFTKYLLENKSLLVPSKPKKKKAKISDSQAQHRDDLSISKLWHLRALILKSLYKCFLYDTEQKILDSANFQVLLKPVVSQLIVAPPESAHLVADAPSVEEADESLVLCLGQMAVTSHSDVLWQQLNREVLMQTRSDGVRPKMLGLRVVKYMIEHLKEEYTVCLAETLPFLVELLEETELPVRTSTQEIIKELETLSGQSLREFL